MRNGAGKSLTLVVAVAKNLAIGINGRMPWHIREELQHFKSVTLGKTVIMGRKTHTSIGRPLPQRQNIVLTLNAGYSCPGCQVAASLTEALGLAESDEVMVIGGAMLYEQALPLADKLIMSVIDLEPAADTFFPAIDFSNWYEVDREAKQPADPTQPGFTVITLRKATV